MTDPKAAASPEPLKLSGISHEVAPEGSLQAALTDHASKVSPEPVVYYYEWDTGFGLRRSFSAAPYNGMPPNRSVALYPAAAERIALLESLLRDTCDYFINDEPLAEDSPDGDLVMRIRAALGEG